MKQRRLWAGLIALGAAILIARALLMLAGGSLQYLKPWVNGLLLLELCIDLLALGTAVRWLVSGRVEDARLPLRSGAAAAITHAVRVLVFVLGRTPALYNFDVRPEHRATHTQRWSWFGVYIAATLSVLGVAAVVVIWQLRRRRARARRRAN